MHVALRHTLHVVARLALALCITASFPLAHVWWGEPYPGDGQKAFGVLATFFVFSLLIACIFLIVGTLFQFALRRRRVGLALSVDAILATLAVACFVYAGATAHYLDGSVS